jgi:hypothetical protein
MTWISFGQLRNKLRKKGICIALSDQAIHVGLCQTVRLILFIYQSQKKLELKDAGKGH